MNEGVFFSAEDIPVNELQKSHSETEHFSSLNDECVTTVD